MKRQSDLAFCAMLLLVWALVLNVEGAATAGEIAAIKAINTAYDAGWSEAAMNNVCASPGPQSALFGIWCTEVGSEGLHILSPDETPQAEKFPEEIKGLIYLDALSIYHYGGHMTNLSAIGTLHSLTHIYIDARNDGCFLEDLSRVTNLQTLYYNNYYGPGPIPVVSGLSQLSTLIITTNQQGPQLVLSPDSFQGLVALTTLSIAVSSTYGIDFIPSLSDSPLLNSLTLAQHRLNDSSLADFDWSTLVNLQTLDLSGNIFVSKLPSTMAALTSLETLNVGYCSLRMPDSFFDMTRTRITELRANSNGMTTTPDQLCQLTTQWTTYGNVTLLLQENPFVSLPDCLWTQPISSLSLGNTSLPTFPTGMTNLYLTYLSWTFNNVPMSFSGTWEVENWSNMTDFTLRNLQLTATFPSGMAGFPALSSFNCPGNHFYGPMPDNFFAGTKLRSFTVSESGITGPFPSSIGTLGEEFEYIEAGFNAFTSIPDSIGQLSGLSYINFTDNELTSIPSNEVWAKLTRLSAIFIGGNTNLQTELPQAWFNYPMYHLNASYCSFYGNHPALNSSELTYLYLSGNTLNGTITPPLRVYSLCDWFVDQNELIGSLPEALGMPAANLRWSILRYFNVSYNRFTGSLPATFNNLLNLQHLGLRHNRFQGILPDFSKLKLVVQFEGDTNFFSICASNPHFSLSYLTINSCTVKDNFYPGACFCPEYVEDACQADTECPAPSFIPLSVPLEAPAPVRPPTPNVPAAEPTSDTSVDPNSAPFAQTPVTVPTELSPDAPAIGSPDEPAAPAEPAEPTTTAPVDVPSDGVQVAPALFVTLAVAAIAIFSL